MPKGIYQWTEEHRQKVIDRMASRREKNVIRNDNDLIMGERVCPLCGCKRLTGRWDAINNPNRLCRSCATKEKAKEQFKLNGHFYRWKGSKYFGGKLLWQWKKNAMDRKFEWDVSYDYLDRLYEKQRGICLLSGEILSFDVGDSNRISLDRIDSEMGYIEGNVQFVTKIINMAKQNLSDDKFIELCNAVCEFHPEKIIEGIG